MRTLKTSYNYVALLVVMIAHLAKAAQFKGSISKKSQIAVPGGRGFESHP